MECFYSYSTDTLRRHCISLWTETDSSLAGRKSTPTDPQRFSTCTLRRFKVTSAWNPSAMADEGSSHVLLVPVSPMCLTYMGNWGMTKHRLTDATQCNNIMSTCHMYKILACRLKFQGWRGEANMASWAGVFQCRPPKISLYVTVLLETQWNWHSPDPLCLVYTKGVLQVLFPLSLMGKKRKRRNTTELACDDMAEFMDDDSSTEALPLTASNWQRRLGNSGHPGKALIHWKVVSFSPMWHHKLASIWHSIGHGPSIGHHEKDWLSSHSHHQIHHAIQLRHHLAGSEELQVSARQQSLHQWGLNPRGCSCQRETVAFGEEGQREGNENIIQRPLRLHWRKEGRLL